MTRTIRDQRRASLPDKFANDPPPSNTGRPPAYSRAHAKLAADLSWLRKNDKEIAEGLGIAQTTFRAWMDKYPSFRSSVESGRDPADAHVVRSLYERATGYSHKAVKILVNQGEIVQVPYVEHYPPDTAAAVRWLEQRRPEWRREAVKMDVNLVVRRAFLELGLNEGDE